MDKEKSLAKCRGFDVGIEDHGLLVMYGTFEYEGSCAQGLGYCIEEAFLYRFLSVFGVERLSQVNGKSCWVTHDNSHIFKIEPLHKRDGAVFDIDEWSEFVERRKAPISPYELRTGKKP